ncbi:MAG: ABC transporter permease subunit [bacterium]|nr:ABC transporter permease subunit [bacterium]
MLNLIKNEYVKILKKKSTIIWLAILLVLSLGLLYLSSRELTVDIIYSDTEYMSKEFVDDQLKSYVTAEEKTYADYYVLLKVKELGMYDRDDWVYTQLTSAADLLSPGTSEANKKIFDAVAISLQSGNPNDYLAAMAAHYGSNTYTFPGSENAITNPYQYCLDENINPITDTKLFEYASTLLFIQDNLEHLYVSDGEHSSSYESAYNSFLVINKLLKEKQSHALIDASVTNTAQSSMNLIGNSNAIATVTSPAEESKFWNILQLSSSLVTMIEILMLIIAGSCVATEFSSGTIKFLLINPVSRSKIIISKYAMVVSFSFICVAVYFVICTVFALLLGGTSDIGGCYITASNGSVTMYSGFIYIAKLYLYAFIDIICYGTLAFALSSLFRNSAISIGISIALSISGNIITSILANINQDWGRYLLFSNTDLATIQEGNSLFPNQTVTFAAIVIVLHLIVFLWTAYDGFTRREV